MGVEQKAANEEEWKTEVSSEECSKRKVSTRKEATFGGRQGESRGGPLGKNQTPGTTRSKKTRRAG